LRLSIKVAALSTILAADLTFFIFFPTRLPEFYDQIFQALPWANTLEMTVAVILGLVITLIVSFVLTRIIVKSLLKSIQRGNENE